MKRIAYIAITLLGVFFAASGGALGAALTVDGAASPVNAAAGNSNNILMVVSITDMNGNAVSSLGARNFAVDSTVVGPGGSLVDIKFKVPYEEYDRKTQDFYKELRQSVIIEGFRRGKAPYQTVLRHFGREALLNDIVDDLGQEVDVDVAARMDQHRRKLLRRPAEKHGRERGGARPFQRGLHLLDGEQHGRGDLLVVDHRDVVRVAPRRLEGAV